METKPGYAIRLKMEMINPDGQIESDIPQGSWYGFDRATANVCCRSLVDTINKLTEQWDIQRGNGNANPGAIR